MNYYEHQNLSYSELKRFKVLYDKNLVDRFEQKIEKEDSRPLFLGTIIHSALEHSLDIFEHIPKPKLNTGKEPEVLSLCIANLDTDISISVVVEECYLRAYIKPKQEEINRFYDKVKDYLLARRNTNKIVLDTNDYEFVTKAYNNITAELNDKFTIPIAVYKELELYGTLEGVPIRGKLDLLLEYNDCICYIDYKSFGKTIEHSITNYGLIGQVSFYEELLRQNGFDKKINSFFIFYDTKYEIAKTIRVGEYDIYCAMEGGYTKPNIFDDIVDNEGYTNLYLNREQIRLMKGLFWTQEKNKYKDDGIRHYVKSYCRLFTAKTNSFPEVDTTL